MQWSDGGIVLSARRHGETGAVVHLLTAGHGRHAGLVHGAAGRRHRGTLQAGNEVTATWRGRLHEHLGAFALELVHSRAAAWLDDPPRLAALASAVALVETTVPEREPHPQIFGDFRALLAALESDAAWPAAYVRWEVALLAELGYGLDLSRCAVTDSREDLVYVSPRTGRAVSPAGAGPYGDRLLALPAFLAPGGSAAPAGRADIAAGLALTGHFLERHVLAPHAARLPAARLRLLDRFSLSSTTSGI